MNTTYCTGKRLSRLRAMFYLIVTVEVAFFYLVYLYILSSSYPGFAGAPLLTIFFVIEVLLMLLIRAGFARMKRRTVYTLTDQGLHISMFFGEMDLPWSDFESAGVEAFGGRKACPVYFMVHGKKFVPCQYLDDIAGLCAQIVERTRDHLEMPDTLDKDLDTYRIMGV